MPRKANPRKKAVKKVEEEPSPSPEDDSFRPNTTVQKIGSLLEEYRYDGGVFTEAINCGMYLSRRDDFVREGRLGWIWTKAILEPKNNSAFVRLRDVWPKIPDAEVKKTTDFFFHMEDILECLFQGRGAKPWAPTGAWVVLPETKKLFQVQVVASESFTGKETCRECYLEGFVCWVVEEWDALMKESSQGQEEEPLPYVGIKEGSASVYLPNQVAVDFHFTAVPFREVTSSRPLHELMGLGRLSKDGVALMKVSVVLKYRTVDPAWNSLVGKLFSRILQLSRPCVLLHGMYELSY